MEEASFRVVRIPTLSPRYPTRELPGRMAMVTFAWGRVVRKPEGGHLVPALEVLAKMARGRVATQRVARIPVLMASQR